eukprot:1186250-Prorocentrum_minimum.AAC.13
MLVGETCERVADVAGGAARRPSMSASHRDQTGLMRSTRPEIRHRGGGRRMVAERPNRWLNPPMQRSAGLDLADAGEHAARTSGRARQWRQRGGRLLRIGHTLTPSASWSNSTLNPRDDPRHDAPSEADTEDEQDLRPVTC